MAYPPNSLGAQVGMLLELQFEDGELIHGKVLEVDPEDREEITYEVVRVLSLGARGPGELSVGATITSPVHTIDTWRQIG